MARFFDITETFSVAGPLSGVDVARAAEAGFATVISNLPEEESFGLDSADALAASADQAGVRFVHIPVSMAQIVGAEFAVPPSQIDAMAEALDAGRTIAFCKAGTRSLLMWALAEVKAKRASPDAVIAAAAAAGVDITPLAARLAAIAEP